jgi:hypothetical protein
MEVSNVECRTEELYDDTVIFHDFDKDYKVNDEKP